MNRPGRTRRGLARLVARVLRWPRQWWVRQSLRARLTLLATALLCGATTFGVPVGYASNTGSRWLAPTDAGSALDSGPAGVYAAGGGVSAPLIGIVTLIYLGVAVSEWWAGRNGMTVVFVGYALANLGLIYEAMR